MFHLRLALFAVILVAAAPPRGKDASPEPPPDRVGELRRNAGTYAVVHYEYNGRKWPEEGLKRMKVVMEKDGSATFEMNGMVWPSQVLLSPDRSPREVDSTYTGGPEKGKTVKGIYKVEGDRMTCCFAAPDQERPKEFASPAGANRILYVIQRTREK